MSAPERPSADYERLFDPDPHWPKTIEAGVAEARQVIDAAIKQHGPIAKSFLLISGGNDSMVLYDVCRDWVDGIVHINTGIGIPQTNEFVREVVGPDLIELHPPVAYDDLVLDPKLFGGFPGPASHHFVYARLKERCVRRLLADHRAKKGERFLLLTGIRNDESHRRMGYGDHINRLGGQVWVNPLLRWSNSLMVEYRVSRDLPVNEVTRHLHMSGECLCGAFARPGELEEIRLFYPDVAARIDALADQARQAGLPACVWGERPPERGAPPAGPLCQNCTLWDDVEAVA